MSGTTTWTSVRQPAVAGTFYPRQANEVQRELDRMLPPSTQTPHPWRAALVPHAGWIYSGHIAAQVFQRIKIPRTVVLLCPKHQREGHRWAVAPYDRWSIPGAELRTDQELAAALVDNIDDLQADEKPHACEHAIEVQLPILAQLAPDVKVVGITVGGGDLEFCHRFADGMSAAIKDDLNSILLVISSDMNHFATDEENRRLDRLAMDELERTDASALFETCHRHQITMCGMVPAVIVMETLRRCDSLNRCQPVAYATSADVSGDRSRVVGYAGMLFE